MKHFKKIWNILKKFLDYDQQIFEIWRDLFCSPVLIFVYFALFDSIWGQFWVFIAGIVTLRDLTIRLERRKKEFNNKKLNTKRIVAFLIDVFLINLFLMICMVLIRTIYPKGFVLIYAGYFTLFFLKDSFCIPSFGHKAMNIRICTGNQLISPFKAFIRNIFLLAWPLELLCLLIFKKRIGDFLVKSEVIVNDNNLVSKKRYSESIILFIVTFAVMLYLVMLFVSKHSYIQLLYQ